MSQPARPSHLRQSTSFSEPRLPVEGIGLTMHSWTTTRSATARATASPSPKTQPWVWQCHLCRRSYRLSTTRRCLDDGHRFCAGTTTVKRSRRTGDTVVRHKACASEFDYAGWRDFGAWRRAMTEVEVDETIDEDRPLAAKHDCWNSCDFPSECRWGKQVGLDMCGQDVSASSSAVIDQTAPRSESLPLAADGSAIEGGDMLVDPADRTVPEEAVQRAYTLQAGVYDPVSRMDIFEPESKGDGFVNSLDCLVRTTSRRA